MEESNVLSNITSNTERQADDVEAKTALHVSNLIYHPPSNYAKRFVEYTHMKMREWNFHKFLLPALGEVKKDIHVDRPLFRVHFTAPAGELTAIIGDKDERHNLIQLLSSRKKTGLFSGDIFLSSNAILSNDYFYDKMAYVQKKSLYIPGLTYREMLEFSVKLRLKDRSDIPRNILVEDRVKELLEIMDLADLQNEVIPPFPELKGIPGANIRRLTIAIEIADLPPLIVIDEPTLDFDPAISVSILECLKTLTAKGHIVVCSMSKPYIQEFDLLDQVVLLSDGFTIFAGPPKKVESYFTGPDMGYQLRKNVDIVEFMLDVASGVERPTTQRTADLPVVMQEKYEVSDYFLRYKQANVNISAFSDEFFFLLGYGRFDKPHYALNRLYTVVYRAIYTKIRDYDALKRGIVGGTFIGAVGGFLQWNQGSAGSYCLKMFNFPYYNTANLTALMFFCTAFVWAFPFLNIHNICQKLQLFRYEQASGVCTTFAFIIATALSEIPVLIASMLMFLNVLYWMSSFNKGQENYAFFMETLIFQSILGLTSAYLFGAICKKELVARDLFLFIVTILALTSGFPFQLGTMNQFFADVSVVNPMRWVFEALMNYRFSSFKDGSAYLAQYSFNTFDHYKIFEILLNFLIASVAALLIFLLKEPLLLRREKVEELQNKRSSMSFSRDSVNSVTASLPKMNEDLIERKSTRQSELVKPVLFMRESSVTGRNSKLSINVSQMGEENMDRGPTVNFKDLNYRVRDFKSPSGYKTILNRVSGQFDWGKLSMIMGSSASGKSSLLQVLAGDVHVGSELSGKIMFNGKEVDRTKSLWERCGFVPDHDDHLRDLTVEEILTYAMKLRCYNTSGYSIVEENVKRTVEILHLEDCLKKKAKQLNTGELKRLSIGEEIVYGPKLLFCDEPTTGVSLHEISILLMTFREMVNQDRTVVVTMVQPTPDAFKLFDTIMLLSQGRVIYHGPVEKAVSYFVSSPFAFDIKGYFNPANFLADISSGFISDSKGEFVNSAILENYYMQSDGYNRLRTRMQSKNPSSKLATSDNPIMKYARQEPEPNPNNLSLSSLPDDTVSIEIDHSNADKQTPTIPKKATPLLLVILHAFFTENFKLPNVQSLKSLFFKGSIIFQRSFLALIKRQEILLSSFIGHILLAILFGIIMGDSSGTTGVYNTISFFAVGSLFLILVNVNFIFYLYNNHQVFLKENSRGLYSNFIKWSSTDFPLYILRILNAIVFITIAWGMTNENDTTDIFGFTVLSYILFILASTLLCECIVFGTSSLRDSYILLTGCGFLNFVYSGLFIKPHSLPAWLGTWAPYLSMIRWNMEGNFIANYKTTGVFPTFPGGFTLYNSFLSLFGWQTQTQWNCIAALFINIIIYKLLSFFLGGLSAIKRKGGLNRERLSDSNHES